MSTVKIDKKEAITLFEALGQTTAEKWNEKRMAGKLAKIADFVDDDVKLSKGTEATLDKVLAAIEAGDDIEVVDGVEEAPAKGKGKKAAKPEPEPEPEPAPAKKKAAAPAPAEKPAKEKKPTKPAKDDDGTAKIPGVRETRTRPFLAGCLIKENGMGAGITDAMVAELDKQYGKTNPAESLFCLRNAWHSIRGYEEGDK